MSTTERLDEDHFNRTVTICEPKPFQFYFFIAFKAIEYVHSARLAVHFAIFKMHIHPHYVQYFVTVRNRLLLRRTLLSYINKFLEIIIIILTIDKC